MKKKISKIILVIGLSITIIGAVGLAVAEGLDGIGYYFILMIGAPVAIIGAVLTIFTSIKGKKRTHAFIFLGTFLICIPLLFIAYRKISEDNGLYYPSFCEDISQGTNEESQRHYDAVCSNEGKEGYQATPE